MTIRRFWLCLVLLLVGLAIFLCVRSECRVQKSGDPVAGAGGREGEHGTSAAIKDVPSSRKVRERRPENEQGIDETFAALKATLPGLTEFPEQTLQERILATNAMLKKAGIRLRFGVDEELYPSQNLLDLKVPAFSQENATPNDILQHSHKAMNKGYLLSDGTVLFQDGSGG
jgi:hypothetical protein